MTNSAEHTDEGLFQLLHGPVKEWFITKYKTFAPAQKKALIHIHSRQNILVSAPTGSGKTLTGFLAIINELVDTAQKGLLKDQVYCVYVSPLKALNQDIKVNLLTPLEEIEKITKTKLGIRVAVRTGDTSSTEKQAMLKKPPHILITTPETLAIVLSSQKFRTLLTNVSWAIIDEVHALAENKRGVHLSLSFERLQRLSPDICRIGLSATIAPLDKVAQFLVGTNRECIIADVDLAKHKDIQVTSPVKNLIDTDPAIVFGQMYTQLDKLIQEHKTTIVFTNTRAATERIVDHLKNRFPKKYVGNIGAHHGSLGKNIRHDIEDKLRKGQLKVCVTSTSLELGIDIGFVDLVVCLGSPKSVARFLQRAGRAGHQLTSTIKARIIVLDRDDLVECSVLLKSALDRKIDKLHIPTNCLDVLAQQITGMAIDEVWNEQELYNFIKQSYCYKNLTWKDFTEILDYLAGNFVDLQERYIFGRIWRKEGKIGRRGKMGRVIYLTNIGTIPDQSHAVVKVGDHVIGTIDESFLEKLRPGDVFVLGGETYEFKFSRGMTAQVKASVNRPPTVPAWFSEMLPLSYDLALEIGKFRRLMFEKFLQVENPAKFVQEYLPVDEKAAQAITDYFKEQYMYTKQIPNDKLIIIETIKGENTKIIFHTLYGRRVNDCLSRAIAFVIGKQLHTDVEVGINDNGFFIALTKYYNPITALKILTPERLETIMSHAIEKSEIYKRRFRHCATRALMILRNYMGRTKTVGRTQVSSQILMSALKRINEEFSILREAKREVLEDVMDIENTKNVLNGILKENIRIAQIQTTLPSPFGFNIALQGHLDVLKIEDKYEFLKRMHEQILAKLGMEKPKVEEYPHDPYNEIWQKEEETLKTKEMDKNMQLVTDAQKAARRLKLPRDYLDNIIEMIHGERKGLRTDFILWLDGTFKKAIPKAISDPLAKFLIKAKEEIR